MKTPNHDLPTGFVECCQICGSKNLEKIIDMGHQPLCDSLLTNSQLKEPETSYPLGLVRCSECSLVQLDCIVPIWFITYTSI